MTEKPLFIPLRTYWFNEFAAGTKDTEYRGGGMDGERVEARAIANERRRRSGS